MWEMQTIGNVTRKLRKESGNRKRKCLTNFVSQSILNKWLAEVSHDTGDWSNGMIGVSKTFGGSSILSSPVLRKS